MGESNSQKGYEKGYGEGRAGKPSHHLHSLDFVNTERQQEYEDAKEKGYQDGKADRDKER